MKMLQSMLRERTRTIGEANGGHIPASLRGQRRPKINFCQLFASCCPWVFCLACHLIIDLT